MKDTLKRLKALLALVAVVAAAYYFSLFMQEKLGDRFGPAPALEAEAATPGE